jgi:hypothetical protein
MTKRNAAVHAATPLILQLLLREMVVELQPVMHPFQRGTIRWELTLEL